MSIGNVQASSLNGFFLFLKFETFKQSNNNPLCTYFAKLMTKLCHICSKSFKKVKYCR